MDITVKEPWPKLRFREKTGQEQDAYLYWILADKFYVSQNSNWEAWGLAQNWIIALEDIIKFYDKKYGLKCTCGKSNNSSTHTCACKHRTINTDLL